MSSEERKNEVLYCLKMARSRIETRWIQGFSILQPYERSYHFDNPEFKDDGDPSQFGYCIEGAIFKEPTSFSGTIIAATLNKLEDCLPPSFGSNLPKFNDRKGRSKKSILALFDKAIKSLEEKEPE